MQRVGAVKYYEIRAAGSVDRDGATNDGQASYILITMLSTPANPAGIATALPR
jgi:hypothetical protein